MNIDDATVDTSVSGVEKIPVSNGGLPRSITVESLGDYVFQRILGLSVSGTSVSTDTFLGSRAGALTSFSVEKLVSLALASVWNGSSITPISGASIPVLSGSSKGVATLSSLSTFIQGEIGASLLALGGLSSASSLSSGDVLLVSQSGVSKKVSWSAVVTAVNSAFSAYVSAQTAVTSLADANEFPIVYGGELRKVTVGTLKSLLGTVGLQGSTTTENYIPQWSSASGVLKGGIPVSITARDASTASDTALLSEKASRSLVGFVGHILLDARSFASIDTSLVMEYDDALSVFNAVVRMPDDWNGGSFVPRILWFPGSGAVVGNNVKFSIGIRPLVAGMPFTGNPSTSVSIVAPVVQGIGLLEAPAVGAALTMSGNTLMLLTISRDTTYDGGVGGVLTGDANVILVELEYTKAFSRGAW